MSQQALLSRARSMLRGRWYVIRKLVQYRLRPLGMRFGYYEYKFRKKTGRPPNYQNPLTFTDKLAWMRLYDHNPLYTQLVDKIAVRDYVRERVGEDVLIPQYGVWKSAEDIDFDSLPNSFVLKCNHESGFVIICRDKELLDTVYVRAQLATRLKMNYYYHHLEYLHLSSSPPLYHSHSANLKLFLKHPPPYYQSKNY